MWRAVNAAPPTRVRYRVVALTVLLAGKPDQVISYRQLLTGAAAWQRKRVEREDRLRGLVRVLAKEEELAFQLLHSLTSDQRKIAIIADKAPSDVRDAGKASPPISCLW